MNKIYVFIKFSREFIFMEFSFIGFSDFLRGGNFIHRRKMLSYRPIVFHLLVRLINIRSI